MPFWVAGRIPSMIPTGVSSEISSGFLEFRFPMEYVMELLRHIQRYPPSEITPEYSMIAQEIPPRIHPRILREFLAMITLGFIPEYFSGFFFSNIRNSSNSLSKDFSGVFSRNSSKYFFSNIEVLFRDSFKIFSTGNPPWYHTRIFKGISWKFLEELLEESWKRSSWKSPESWKHHRKKTSGRIN